MPRPVLSGKPAARLAPRPGPRRVAFPLLVLVLSLFPSQAATAASCTASGPSSGAYTVTVCIQTPGSGSAITGDVLVRGTATVSGSTATPRRMTFELAGEPLLTDFAAPFEFTLPSTRWADGTLSLSATANLTNNFTSDATTASLSFSNGITEPTPIPATFSPTTGASPGPGEPFVVAAVGDGADGGAKGAQVAGLVNSWNPNMFLYLGDVYEQGTYTEMLNWYGTTPGSWGGLRSVTNPVVGNHEYGAGPEAPGYFDYWGQPPHHYSVDAGGWRLMALDTTTQFGQRAAGTDQVTWLEQQLASSLTPCTLAFGHHPRFSIGGHNDDPGMDPIWSRLVDGGADLFVAGHAHNYQRWSPLDAAGLADAGGLTELVVGTGGHSPAAFSRTDTRVARGFDRAPQGFGAIRLELNAEGAAFAYYQSNGTPLDWGSIPCREAPSDILPPTPPGELTASASADQVDLQWKASLDNVGVTGYEIHRDGQPLATVPPVTAFTDTSVAPGESHRYEVLGVDGSGGVSTPGLPVDVTVPTTVFEDGFESGDLARWTTSAGMVVQQADVDQGQWAVRAATSGGPGASARKTLTKTRAELLYRTRFKVTRRSTAAGLIVLQTATGNSQVSVSLAGNGALSLRNHVTPQTLSSSTVPAVGEWHELLTRVSIAGVASEVEVWLDGTRIDALSRTTSLGTNAMGRVVLGDGTSGRSFDIAYDGVDVSLPPQDVTAPTTVFGDGFESGDLSRWTSSSGMVVQQAEVDQGAWAARATTAGGPGASARKTLTESRPELIYATRFKVIQRSTPAGLIVLQNPSGTSLVSVSLAGNGSLSLRNHVTPRTLSSSTVPTLGMWHELRTRVSIAGAASEVEVWLDGTRIDALSRTTSLGTNGMGRLVLGDGTSGRSFDIAYDGVEVDLPTA